MKKYIIPLNIILILILFLINHYTINRHLHIIYQMDNEITELNEYVDDLIQYIETIPDTVYIDNIVYRYRTSVKVDTVFVQQKMDYYQIEPIRVIDFSITDKEEGVYIQLDGYVKFIWDMDIADYEVVQSEITDKMINLNMSAHYSIVNDNLNLILTNPSSDVNVVYIHNDQLSLRKVYVPERNRWGFGVLGGVGLVNSGITPFVGVGITYQFTDFNFKKLRNRN
jgi:hypothetical protein